MHDSDEWLGEATYACIHSRKALAVFDVFLTAVLLHGAHPVEVAAGAEGFAVAENHREAHFIAALHVLDGLGQLADEVAVKRIMHLWPVQAQERRAACINFDGERLVVAGHAAYILKTPKRVSSSGALR